MKKKILSICTVALLCSSIFADEWDDQRVKRYRTENDSPIQAKKRKLNTDWDALAIIKIAQENIDNGINVQENLDLIKGVMKGRGFAKGVVNVSISADERNIMLNGLTSYGGKIAESQPWQGFVTQNYGADKGGAHGDASILQPHLQAVDDQIRKGISSSSSSSAALQYNFAFRDLDKLSTGFGNSDPTYMQNNLLQNFGHRKDFHTLLDVIDNDCKYFSGGADFIKAFKCFNIDKSEECFNEFKRISSGHYPEFFYKRMKNAILQNCIEQFRKKNRDKDASELDFICLHIVQKLNHVEDKNYIELALNNLVVPDYRITPNWDQINELHKKATLYRFSEKEKSLIYQLLNISAEEQKDPGGLLDMLDEIATAVDPEIKKAAIDSFEEAINIKKLELITFWAVLIKSISTNRINCSDKIKIIDIINKFKTNKEKSKIAEIVAICTMIRPSILYDFLNKFTDLRSATANHLNDFIVQTLNPDIKHFSQDAKVDLLTP